MNAVSSTAERSWPTPFASISSGRSKVRTDAFAQSVGPLIAGVVKFEPAFEVRRVVSLRIAVMVFPEAFSSLLGWR